MGGNKGKIYERIAKHGNGWFAPTADPAELRDAIGQIESACAAVGRDPAEIEITCMWPGQGGKDAVARLADAGVHRLVVPLQALGEDPAAGVQRLAEEVI
jgi:alkanesulfonate monooxygenase SsuD/methylene tetrahydromethanopterin reductase-like flavin-dependent oxidoreductase (luciferase family)